MDFLFQGLLRAYLCDDCHEVIPNARVRLYRIDPDVNPVESASASIRETVSILDKKTSKKKESRLLAEATSGENGSFEFKLNDSQDKYQGEAFELDLIIEQVPGQKREKKERVHVHITTLQPKWRQTNDGLVANFSEFLSSKIWCYIRALFDAWVICGYVRDCQRDNIPLGNVRVIAFDDDWITDDRLGEAVTDANGHFRIDYSSRDFKQTFLSPVINVETPFPPFNSGPDVYFRVETNSASPFVLLEEPSSTGRQSGRKDAGACLCVSLCVETDRPGSGETGYEPALFTHVGQYDIYGGIDAAGFTNDSQQNAFTRNIPLNGSLPGGNSSNAMEYRFRIINLNTASELSPAEVNDALLPTIIGQLQRRFPHNPSVPDSIPGIGYYRVEPFYVNNPSAPNNVNPNADGWIEVPRNNDLDTVGLFQPIWPGGVSLARIDTTKLYDAGTFDLNSPTVHAAGSNMDSADQFAGPDQAFRMIFEAREVGAGTLSNFNTLARLVIWNGSFTFTRHPHWSGGVVNTHRGVAMVDINEVASGGGCGNVNNSIQAQYTAYHPYIENVGMKIQGPSGDFGLINPSPDAQGEASGNHVYDLTGQPNCAYILWLTINFRLTSGYGRRDDAWLRDYLAFCKG